MSLIRLLNDAEQFTEGRDQAGYSKVILNVTDEITYVAGNDTGETLEVTCPWGTQAIANSILTSIRGFAYKPYSADNALLDPSAEIGDSVNLKGIQSGIYTLGTQFGSLMTANISAPAEEDIDSEYPYESSEERQITRQLAEFGSTIRQQADQISAEVTARQNADNEIASQLSLQASEISAKVSQTGGNSQSFSWRLTADGFVLANGSSQVFKADSTGIKVTGEIHATSGFIGTDSNGFKITSSAISKGLNSFSATGSGIYIGTDGINLGGKFKVSSSGDISASSATFTGSVYASNIKSDSVNGVGGSFSGRGLSSGSVNTGRLSSGINTSLGYADYAHSVFAGSVTASWVKASSGSFSSLGVNGYDCSWIAAQDRWGDNIYVLGRR